MDNENQRTDVDEVEEVENDTAGVEIESSADETREEQNEQDGTQSTDKIVNKLQKRLGKEKSEKNEYKAQLEDALSKIEKLKKGEDPDEEPQPDEKDSKIAQLEAQLKKRDITEKARTVLDESGVSVPKNILEIVVTDDDNKTLDNVRALLTFTQQVKDEVRQEYLKGKTPSSTGKPVKSVSKKEFDAMNMADKTKLFHDNPTLFAKLTQ